jgi:hypothetical protein
MTATTDEINKILCKTTDCDAMILPTTATRNDGLCEPCYKKFLLDNRRIINLYEKITDPVQIIKIYHHNHKDDLINVYEPYEGKIFDCYKQLTTQEAQNLYQYAITLYKCQNYDEAKRIMIGIVALNLIEVTEFLNELIENQDYQLPLLFHHCSTEILTQLLNNLAKNLDHKINILDIIIWLYEKNNSHLFSISTPKIINEILDPLKRVAYTINASNKILDETDVHTIAYNSLLNEVCLYNKNELAPILDSTLLQPVLQLCIKDLPINAEALKEVAYLCIYIAPELDQPNQLVIRAYKDTELKTLTIKESLNRNALQIKSFSSINDYNNHFIDPFTLKRNGYKNNDEIYKIFGIDENCHDISSLKIMGYPEWIQESEGTDDEFILQLDGHDIWDYGDASSLYVFRNKNTKEFWGTIQMY